MKRLNNWLFALLFIMVMFISMVSPVFAATSEATVEPRESYYISSTYASISGGDGSVTIYFDITGTRPMTNIGATTIQIKNSSGTTIKTFYSSSTSGMMGSNRMFHSGSVTYDGVLEGARYYAVVSFKAADSTGYDTATYTTSYTTA